MRKEKPKSVIGNLAGGAPTSLERLPVRKMRKAVPVCQGIMAVVFLAMFFVMLSPRMADGKLAAQGADLAIKAIWVFWFPVTLASVVITGRAWCGMLCPMGALSELAGRQGFRKPLPGWVRSPATPIASFLLITVLGQVLAVRSNPPATAVVLGGNMILAVAVGLMYGRGRNRPWCRHACPIGFLLGLFGRLGMVDFRQTAPAQQRGGEGYVEKGPCPTMIALSGKTSARHCIECLRCVGARQAEKRTGIEITLRRPGAEIEDVNERGADGWEVAGLFLASGMALGGFLWPILPQYQVMRGYLWSSRDAEMWPSWALRSPAFPWLVRHLPSHKLLDGLAIAGFMLASMLVVAALLYISTALSAALAGRSPLARGLPRSWTMIRLGYQFMPMSLMSLLLGLGGHLLQVFGDRVRAGLLVAAAGWSLWLGWRILSSLAVPVLRRPAALLPGLAGVTLLAALWSPALGITDPRIAKLEHFAMPDMAHRLPMIPSPEWARRPY